MQEDGSSAAGEPQQPAARFPSMQWTIAAGDALSNSAEKNKKY